MSTAATLGPDQTSHAWDQVVESYEDVFEPFTNCFAAEALRLVPVCSGHRVLDVAAGPGGLTLAALEHGAEVTAIDFSPRMIAHLRRRLSREQRWRSLTVVMDGQRLELPDATFDAAFSIFGLIFFPDPARGLREMVRVLKPGGHGVVAAWSSPRRHEALQLITEVLGAVWPDFRPPPQPTPWLCYQDPETFRAALADAGFAAPAIRTIAPTWEIPSAEWFVAHVPSLSPGTNFLFERMTPAIAAAFNATLRSRLEERFGDGPVRFRAEAHLGVGRKS